MDRAVRGCQKKSAVFLPAALFRHQDFVLRLLRFTAVRETSENWKRAVIEFTEDSIMEEQDPFEHERDFLEAFVALMKKHGYDSGRLDGLLFALGKEHLDQLIAEDSK